MKIDVESLARNFLEVGNRISGAEEGPDEYDNMCTGGQEVLCQSLEEGVIEPLMAAFEEEVATAEFLSSQVLHTSATILSGILAGPNNFSEQEAVETSVRLASLLVSTVTEAMSEDVDEQPAGE